MENLKLLFEKAQIDYIISVDDCYTPNNHLDEVGIAKYFNHHHDIAVDFCNEIGLNSFESTLSFLEGDNMDYIETVVGELTAEQKELFQNRYYVADDTERIGLMNFCQNLKDHQIISDFKTISTITEAQRIHNEMSLESDESSKKVLWLIDDDFQRTNGTSKDGTKLIKDFIENPKPNCIYALTSAQLNSDTNNTSFREEFENIANSNLLLACVLHKHKILEKAYNELYKDMYLGFRENHSGTIIGQLNSNLELASKSSASTIKSLKDDAIHKVFLLASKSEGVSPLETFQRLMMVILKTDISNEICTNYDSISKLIYDYSELCSWCETNWNDKDNVRKIGEIRRDECYDKNINKMYAPVSYGDIFIINDSPYILLTQACNVIIREKGDRKAQCATLAAIECSDIIEGSHYLLEYFDPSKKHRVNFNSVINVDFSALDLCCLNADGQLCVSRNFEIDDYKHRYTDGTVISLKKTIKHNLSLLSEYEEIKNNKNSLSTDELIQKIRTIFKDNTTELTASFSNGIRYNATRLYRLNPNLTDDLCKKYSDYHSRKGLDFDFAKQYKILEFEWRYDFNFAAIGCTHEKYVSLKRYQYYLSEKLTDTKLKSQVISDFKHYYDTTVLVGADLPITSVKVDLKHFKISVDANSIPIRVNENNCSGILSYKNDVLTVSIPKPYIESKLLHHQNAKSTNTYNNQPIHVSNKTVAFQFNVGQPLHIQCAELFDLPLTLSFSNTENITLTIT